MNEGEEKEDNNHKEVAIHQEEQDIQNKEDNKDKNAKKNLNKPSKKKNSKKFEVKETQIDLTNAPN